MTDPSNDPGSEIVVYWRPGCGFCAMLFRKLDRLGVPHRRVDIWSDPDGAATVRSLADGNETVPTVVVGPVSMVNPSADDVLVAATEHAPGAVPEGWTPPEPGRLGSWLRRQLGG